METQILQITIVKNKIHKLLLKIRKKNKNKNRNKNSRLQK